MTVLSPRHHAALAVTSLLLAAFSTWFAVHYAKMGDWNRVVAFSLSVACSLFSMRLFIRFARG